jgi:hypothetical protein
MTKKDERFKQGDRDKIRLTDEQYQIVLGNIRERQAFWERVLADVQTKEKRDKV